MVGALLRRGVLAGLLAGLLAGTFAYFFGEPAIDRALLLEEDPGTFNAVVSRPVQKLGLVAATALYGMAVGVIFALVFSRFRDRMDAGRDWGRSLRLSAALFAGFFFLPFLKYPSDPPGTGDTETLGYRTAAYLLAVVLCLLLLLVAWYSSRFLRARRVSAPVRQTAVGAGLIAALIVLFALLPPATDVGEFPGGVLWDFRLSTLGTQIILWGGLGAFFGALCELKNRNGPGEASA
jgi:hypothetical protein